MLEVKHISKAYKDNVILEDINFTIKKGEVISIVGNSGCGKSTILKCLNRLENISSGEILLNGKDITEYKLIFTHTKKNINFGIEKEDIKEIYKVNECIN